MTVREGLEKRLWDLHGEPKAGANYIAPDPYRFLRWSVPILIFAATLGLFLGLSFALMMFLGGRFSLALLYAGEAALGFVLLMALAQAIRLLFEVRDRVRDVQSILQQKLEGPGP